MATQQLYFFSEDSTVPNSILDGTAWSSTEYSEGRALLEKAAYNTTTAEAFKAATQEESLPHLIEPVDDR